MNYLFFLQHGPDDTCGFTGFHDTRILRLEIISLPTSSPCLSCLHVSHGWSHWCFQFLTSILATHFSLQLDILSQSQVYTTSQSWLRTKKLRNSFKTVVGTKHDVTVEVPLRSTRRHCNLTLQRQKQRQIRRAHLRAGASARHLVTSPTTNACLKHSNFLNSDRHNTRIVQLLFM